MRWEWLTTAQVIEAHAVLMDRWKGEDGIGHRGAVDGIEAAVQAVKNSYYETPAELAAAYAVYIVQGHVFMDGNKRSGLAAATMFLDGNNITYRGTNPRLWSAMTELQTRAERGERTDVLVAWLANILDVIVRRENAARRPAKTTRPKPRGRR